MRLVIVTGLSGAGKSHAVKVMEDLKFFCVDNLPPSMIVTLVNLCRKEGQDRVAIGADIRGGRFFGDIANALNDLKANGIGYEMLFLDAADETLVKRYKETRHEHPLAGSYNDLASAISAEREQLSWLRDGASFVIDTSQLLPKQLRERLIDVFADEEAAGFHITFVTFGFKRGIPAEADIVFDVRFIPNPFYVDGMREKTGRDEDVRQYVMDFEGTQMFIDSVTEQLLFLIPMFKREAKNELVVAIGCTGGQHRSVVLGDALQMKMLKAGYRATVSHRDMARDRETRQ